MMITINNSTVSINIHDDTINKAKDKLLSKLYYARHKPTMGGFQAWQQLLSMYYRFDYEGMKKHIESYHGRGQQTRNECLECLNIIIGGQN